MIMSACAAAKLTKAFLVSELCWQGYRAAVLCVTCASFMYWKMQSYKIHCAKFALAEPII